MHCARLRRGVRVMELPDDKVRAIAGALVHFAPQCSRCDGVAVGRDSVSDRPTCGDVECLGAFQCGACGTQWSPCACCTATGCVPTRCQSCGVAAPESITATVLDAPWSVAVRWAVEVLK